jgi:hypothetical protein
MYPGVGLVLYAAAMLEGLEQRRNLLAAQRMKRWATDFFSFSLAERAESGDTSQRLFAKDQDFKEGCWN